jgi:hypothetical protein
LPGDQSHIATDKVMPVEEDPSLEACDDLQIVGTKFNIDEDCRNIAGAAC